MYWTKALLVAVVYIPMLEIECNRLSFVLNGKMHVY